MEPDENSESPSISDDANAKVPANGQAAAPSTRLVPSVPADHNREAGEKTTGKGDLQDSPAVTEKRDEATCQSDGGREEEGESSDMDSELEEEEEEDEAEYDDDEEDMFFDQFEPSPQVLQRNNSMKEPMVPYGCSDPEEALQHFVQVFKERYGKAHPHFYVGSLENAVKEVTDMKDADKLRPLLIFIHNDDSILAHIFCSEVLCSEPVVDYLNTNYITWPWDITNQENKETLLSMVEECFSGGPQDDEQKENKSFEVMPPWFKQPRTSPQHHQQGPFSPAEHVPPKSVLQRLVARVDDLPACLIFYPVSGQPHSIQGTWLASKSSGDMCESFLAALVSSVEDYKVLLQQSQHSKEDKQLYDFLQQRHMQLKQGQAPPTGPSHPLAQLLAPPTGSASFTLPQVDWGNLLQNIHLVTRDDATTLDQSKDQNTMSQVQQEHSETQVESLESQIEETQEQETAENSQFHLNTDSPDE